MGVDTAVRGWREGLAVLCPALPPARLGLPGRSNCQPPWHLPGTAARPGTAAFTAAAQGLACPPACLPARPPGRPSTGSGARQLLASIRAYAHASRP
jgi:hypothetical protein